MHHNAVQSEGFFGEWSSISWSTAKMQQEKFALSPIFSIIWGWHGQRKGHEVAQRTPIACSLHRAGSPLALPHRDPQFRQVLVALVCTGYQWGSLTAAKTFHSLPYCLHRPQHEHKEGLGPTLCRFPYGTRSEFFIEWPFLNFRSNLKRRHWLCSTHWKKNAWNNVNIQCYKGEQEKSSVKKTRKRPIRETGAEYWRASSFFSLIQFTDNGLEGADGYKDFKRAKKGFQWWAVFYLRDFLIILQTRLGTPDLRLSVS